MSADTQRTRINLDADVVAGLTFVVHGEKTFTQYVRNVLKAHVTKTNKQIGATRDRR